MSERKGPSWRFDVIESIGSGRSATPEEPELLSRIRRRLVEAAAGEGRAVYLEGPPRSGKTQLLLAANEAARSVGMGILEARGHLLERDFPFGVAIQLLDERWFAAPEGDRSALLRGPARPAGEMLSGAVPVGSAFAGDRVYVVIHGLFWLTRALTGGGTRGAPDGALALIVDDVDRADGPSLRFLAYLASRIRGLPLALVVTARPASSSDDAPALTALRSASELHVIGSMEQPAAGGPRRMAAQMALRKSRAEGHRESIVDLAELAWGDGALLESDEDRDAWPDLVGALLFVDDLERAVEVARAATRPGPAVVPPGAAQHWTGWSLYHPGQITAALAAAEMARAARRDDRAVHGLIAACRLAQGRLDEAEVALPTPGDGEDIEGLDTAVLLDLRAQLRLAQLRPTDALEDALDAGRRCTASWGSIGPGVVAWRSTAALARLALGQRERARALAQDELALARERGLGRVVIRDLRILAFAARGTRTLDLLTEAVKVGRAAPARLEYMNALVDLGAATRRANQRMAARPPLRTGLELAERGGAAALARRAREELEATGARSRRVMLTGINALTPSERRVADLAAGGLTTRQIAQVLFVTPKTVEFHLRHVYRKLDIPSSRADLARALSPADSG
jgi:DNA-binding CsgD family transcriptional regulator